jgi:hypothetical protein
MPTTGEWLGNGRTASEMVRSAASSAGKYK